jgi:hypothetical protein
LSANTTYHYRLESNGWPLTEDFTFRTAADTSHPSFTFAVFGDTRTGHDRHRAVIDRLVALAPDFALPRENGQTLRLSDSLGKSAVVLVFYRGQT